MEIEPAVTMDEAHELNGFLHSSTHMLLEIAKWKETFEKSDSRKVTKLQWVAVPVDNSSAGYMQLAEDYPDELPMIYGCFLALVGIASGAHIRGVLADSKGRPFSIRRLAMMSRMPEECVKRAVEVCIEIGWIISSPANDNHTGDAHLTQQNTENGESSRHHREGVGSASGCYPDGIPTASGDHPDAVRTPSRLQDRTVQDKTGHNKTRTNTTSITDGTITPALAFKEIENRHRSIEDKFVWLYEDALRVVSVSQPDDVAFIAKAAMMVAHPHYRLSESQFREALESIQRNEKIENQIAYFVSCIRDSMGMSREEMAGLLRQVTIPDEYVEHPQE